MSKIFFSALAVLILITSGVVGWQYRAELLPSVSLLQQTPGFPPDITSLLAPLDHVREELTPAPLRAPSNANGTLTIAGVLTATNSQRVDHNLPSLAADTTLNEAAKHKLDDMFAQQYFEHISPDGRGPSDVVDAVGYEYIRVGENLALGNFTSDSDLVQAWMDSPGHRANILHTGFDAIGIAVGQGMFEGHRTWLAVQTFAKPLSSCPGVDTTLQKKIATLQTSLENTSNELISRQGEITKEQKYLQQLAAEIERLIQEGNDEIERGNQVAKETGDNEQAEPHWDRGEELHRQAQEKQQELKERNTSLDKQVANYNQAVNAQQAAQAELSKLADTINNQVRAFNACLEK